ncbi:MAG: hypothetical protein KBC48_02170 [Candidatus Pacebacteria bacterium]|nr:hypothetical protein [Candidatus Paceibacterota bacterium]
MDKKNKHTIAILNTAKGTILKDNFISGFDIGIQNEGENLIAKGNIFHTQVTQTKKKFSMDNPVVFIIANIIFAIIIYLFDTYFWL